MTEWNPTDPDAERVFYDLAEWDFDQQAELASALAEAEIPHGWDGSELVVPGDFEETTDAVFADVEQRLGIIGKGTGDPAALDDEDDTGPVRVLDADEVLTEYDLTEWQALERSLVADSLGASNVPFRWEDTILLVPTADEERVDGILDDIESGNVIPVINDGVDGDELPFESLNSFFLAGERLRKDARDASGLERLLEALKIADPDRPPMGVELRVWRRSCELAEQLADSLVANTDATALDSGQVFDDGDEPHITPGMVVDADGNEIDASSAIAGDLHDLLRPLI